MLYVTIWHLQSSGIIHEPRADNDIEDHDAIDLYLNTNESRYFDLLYSRYINKIYSKCISILKDSTLAEDATQDIFIKIFTNLARFNKKSRFSTWVYSITYNYCIDLIRKNKKLHNLINEDDDTNIPDLSENEIDDKILFEIEIERLKYLLEQIPSEDKQVLLMKYKKDMSIKEICDIFGKSESAIKMKIKRAKEKVFKLHQENYMVS